VAEQVIGDPVGEAAAGLVAVAADDDVAAVEAFGHVGLPAVGAGDGDSGKADAGDGDGVRFAFDEPDGGVRVDGLGRREQVAAGAGGAGHLRGAVTAFAGVRLVAQQGAEPAVAVADGDDDAAAVKAEAEPLMASRVQPRSSLSRVMAGWSARSAWWAVRMRSSSLTPPRFLRGWR
jgi:hypothetical protein